MSVDIGGEALTLQAGKWRWVDTGVPLKTDQQTNAVKVMPMATVTVTGLWPNWDKALVSTTIGRINEASFLGFGTHELLFNGLNISPGTNAKGSDTLSLSYHFSWNPYTFRKLWRQETNSYVTVSDANGFPYEDVPFSDINPINW